MESRQREIAILLFFLLIIVGALVSVDDLKIMTAQAENRIIDYLGQVPPGTTPERFAPDVISVKGAIHGSIAFNPDVSEIYWTLYPPIFLETPPMIMYVKKVDGSWTAPVVTSFCDENGASEISVSPSGDRLYFASRRPLPRDWGYQLEPGSREWGVGKIWFVEREGDGWSEPYIHEKRINQDLNGVSATSDGTLYSSGIRRIRKTADGWGSIERLGPPLDITKPGGQFMGGHPYVAPDESFILFNDRWPAHRGYGIFVSFRDSADSWSNPINMLAELGVERGGSVPVLSPDGKYLFYYAAGGFWWVDAKIIEELKPDYLK